MKCVNVCVFVCVWLRKTDSLQIYIKKETKNCWKLCKTHWKKHVQTLNDIAPWLYTMNIRVYLTNKWIVMFSNHILCSCILFLWCKLRMQIRTVYQIHKVNEAFWVGFWSLNKQQEEEIPSKAFGICINITDFHLRINETVILLSSILMEMVKFGFHWKYMTNSKENTMKRWKMFESKK